MQDESRWVRADFNGVVGDLLCLSHSDKVATESGDVVHLCSGMELTAFDDDADDRGRPDKILATGVVERSPDWLQCNGSRWVLRIDASGIRHASDLCARG
jgi:hypothetical protein